MTIVPRRKAKNNLKHFKLQGDLISLCPRRQGTTTAIGGTKDNTGFSYYPMIVITSS